MLLTGTLKEKCSELSPEEWWNFAKGRRGFMVWWKWRGKSVVASADGTQATRMNLPKAGG